MLWKGSQVPQEEDEEAVTINQGVGDIRFTNILQLFSIYFFFSITLLYHFFSILFLPTTFTHTHTHDPRPLPTTFSYPLHFHVNMNINFRRQTFEVWLP